MPCLVRWKSNNSPMWVALGVSSHVTCCNPVFSGRFMKNSGSLRLSSPLSLPFLSSCILLSCVSLFQCYSLKRQIVRTSNEGIVLCNRNKCPLGNDSSCSRLPSGLHARPGSHWACARQDGTMEIYLSASPYARWFTGLIQGCRNNVKRSYAIFLMRSSP